MRILSLTKYTHKVLHQPCACHNLLKKNWSKLTKNLRLAVLHAITPAC